MYNLLYLYSYNNKYLGTIYILGGEIGLLAASILDTKLKFVNSRSFDINGTGQFIADYMMQDELLNNWKFKATTQDIYNLNYETNAFSAVLPDGNCNSPVSLIFVFLNVAIILQISIYC
mgnify:CR=1 FL=1